MFMLLLVPVLNSIFLVLVSLLVQLSISTFSVNLFSFLKLLFFLICNFISNLINKWGLVIFLFSINLTKSMLNKEMSDVVYELYVFYVLFYVFYVLFYVFFFVLGFYYDFFLVLVKVFVSFFFGGEREFQSKVGWKWDNWVMKVFMKMGVGGFLLMMMSYMSVFGHFLFFWKGYIAIMCGLSGLSFSINLFNWLMSIMVIIMSSLVLMTSMDYLDMLYIMYFLCLLSYFQLFMLGFMFTDSLMIMYVNWDWLGMISYLLINLYFNSQKNGLKAMIFNKLGDIVFLIIMAYFMYHFLPLMNFFPSLSINLLFNIFIIILASFFVQLLSFAEKTTSNVNVTVCLSWLLVSFGLLVVFFTKSAQLPFSSWLINAMAAPTPVSSLLHSSTMVMMGMFLCLLLSPVLYVLMDLFNYMNICFVNLCAFTLLWSLLKAFSSLNMKSIMAYSTVNQLSYMFLSFKICSLIVLFHIIVHAVFKCMLFLMAGSLIHTSSNFQNIFKMNYFTPLHNSSTRLQLYRGAPLAARVLHAQASLQSSLNSKKVWWLCESECSSPRISTLLSRMLNSLCCGTFAIYIYFILIICLIFSVCIADLFYMFCNLIFSFADFAATRVWSNNNSTKKMLYISFLMGSFMLVFALSKELIIMGLMNMMSSSFLFYLVLLGALGTLIYSFLLIYFIFFSTTHGLSCNNNSSKTVAIVFRFHEKYGSMVEDTLKSSNSSNKDMYKHLHVEHNVPHFVWSDLESFLIDEAIPYDCPLERKFTVLELENMTEYQFLFIIEWLK